MEQARYADMDGDWKIGSRRPEILIAVGQSSQQLSIGESIVIPCQIINVSAKDAEANIYLTSPQVLSVDMQMSALTITAHQEGKCVVRVLISDSNGPQPVLEASEDRPLVIDVTVTAGAAV